MAYRIERTAAADSDLWGIYDFLIDSYRHFGADTVASEASAQKRLRSIHASMRKLAEMPHQGTRDSHLLPNLRHVTKDRAIFYFTVDDVAETVTVLAIFYGGQDHGALIRERLQ